MRFVDYDWDMKNGTDEYAIAGNYSSLARFQFHHWYMKESVETFPEFHQSVGFAKLSIYLIFRRQLAYYFIEGFLPGTVCGLAILQICKIIDISEIKRKLAQLLLSNNFCFFD